MFNNEDRFPIFSVHFAFFCNMPEMWDAFASNAGLETTEIIEILSPLMEKTSSTRANKSLGLFSLRTRFRVMTKNICIYNILFLI